MLHLAMSASPTRVNKPLVAVETSSAPKLLIFFFFPPLPAVLSALCQHLNSSTAGKNIPL